MVNIALGFNTNLYTYLRTWWNGIHKRLKISRRIAYEFESRSPHHYLIERDMRAKCLLLKDALRIYKCHIPRGNIMNISDRTPRDRCLLVGSTIAFDPYKIILSVRDARWVSRISNQKNQLTLIQMEKHP